MSPVRQVTQPKEVHIVARIQSKRDPRKVAYQVLSSDGVTKYLVSLFQGRVCGCNCPDRTQHCYHRAGVQAYEDARIPALAAVA